MCVKTWFVALWCGVAGVAGAQSDLIVYDDALQNGWQSWSWSGTYDLANTNAAYAGNCSIAAQWSGWGALSLHHSGALSPADFARVEFYVRAASSTNVQLWLALENDGGTPPLSGWLALNNTKYLPGGTIGTGVWKCVSIPLTDIPAAPASFTRVDIGDQNGSGQPLAYLDQIRLVGFPSTVTTTPAVVAVDAAADQHAINPQIYGVCFGSSNQLQALNAPLNRSGGNATSRYNWETNAANHASDWYFESLADASSVAGATADDFVRDSLGGNAQPMLTIPINGWVARLGPSRGRLCGYSIAKYGAQTGSDTQWFPDAGNGVLSATGKAITNNNPTDANLAVTPAFQANWISHLTNLWGSATNGGVRYYLMDNEWGLWHATHRDVWPVGATMEQMRDRFCDYADMVKTADTGALVLGPEEWGLDRLPVQRL